MKKYKVYLTEPAENDLYGIARYISSQLNAPKAAYNTIVAIKKAITKLETNAPIYPLVRDDRLAALGYRLLIVKNYIIFFVVNEKDKSVDIDRILHGCRDWQSIL